MSNAVYLLHRKEGPDGRALCEPLLAEIAVRLLVEYFSARHRTRPNVSYNRVHGKQRCGSLPSLQTYSQTPRGAI